MTNAPTTICRHHADVAEIQLVNPPVNGLGYELRHSLYEQLSQVLRDAGVRAVVLTGAGKMFCGGADIRQFNTAKATMQPMLRDINRLIESSGKPVIAAIHGNALGGGLELAMSCHYRMATTETLLALPEVKLGILPGGGGTQRLPRLVGLEMALGLIVSGEAMDASQAHACGLIDEIVSGDLLEAALMQARLAAQKPPSSLRVTSALSVLFDGDIDSYFEAQRSRLAKETLGLPAPLECLACLKASLTLPFEQALTLERAKVQALLDSPESKELRRQFFARREASRLTSSH